LVLGLGSQSRAQLYVDPPEALKVKVDQAVHDVLMDRDPDQLSFAWPELVAYTVADALLEGPTAISPDKVLKYDTEVAETARFDKQIGSGSSTTGTTTLVEKAGVSRLIAWAVEHGAVQQEQNGTSLTLSTTPYALGLVATGAEDTADRYSRWCPAPRIALGVNFALDGDKKDTVGGAEFDDVTALWAKWNFWGDRSPRSKWFQDEWVKRVQPFVKKRLQIFGPLLVTTLNDDEDLTKARNDLESKWQERLEAELQALGAAQPTPEMQERLAQAILDDLRVAIFDRFSQPPGGAEERRARLAKLVPALNAANVEVREARAAFLKLVDEMNGDALGTVSSTTYRVDGGSDYSELTLIFQDRILLFDIAVNGEVSFNHNPDGSLDQETVRDFGASVSIERQFDNFLLGRLSPGDLSPITLAASGKVSYLEEAHDEIGIAQLRIDVPVYAGFTVPFALTYATRTEEQDESDFRVNIGVDLDTDKMMALVRLGTTLLGSR
jgi:hypothetical protein